MIESTNTCRHCGEPIEHSQGFWAHVPTDPRRPIPEPQCTGDAWGEIAEPTRTPKGPRWFEENVYNPPRVTSGVPSDLFPDGVPIRGELTEAQRAWLRGRS
jgi:hypothetical protein